MESKIKEKLDKYFVYVLHLCEYLPNDICHIRHGLIKTESEKSEDIYMEIIKEDNYADIFYRKMAIFYPEKLQGDCIQQEEDFLKIFRLRNFVDIERSFHNISCEITDRDVDKKIGEILDKYFFFIFHKSIGEYNCMTVKYIINAENGKSKAIEHVKKYCDDIMKIYHINIPYDSYHDDKFLKIYRLKDWL